MEALASAVVGVLFAAGFYMLLRRDMVKMAVGLALLGHAANLLIFTAGGLTRAAAPVVDGAGQAAAHADPVPQALILTAIVIGFGVLAFALALIERAARAAGSADASSFRGTDP